MNSNDFAYRAPEPEEHGQDPIPLAQPRSTTFVPKMIPVSGIEAQVCDDIARRQKMGVKKYGTTLADNPAGEIERLQHAYEETLDLANYLKWQILSKQDEMSRTKQCARFSASDGVEKMHFATGEGFHSGTVVLRPGETLIVTKVLSK